MPFHHKVKML